jgi:hypothetical protein
MRLYAAICTAIEAWAERTRSEGLEQEFANADWSMSQADDDE